MNGNGGSAASCRDARVQIVIGVGDEARVGGGTGDDRDAQDRPGSRRDRRGDQRLAVADVAHQQCAVSAAIRAAFTGELPVVHGFALARGAGDLESPVGRATEAAAALERVAARQDSGPVHVNANRPTARPVLIAQHPARDLPMSDVVRIRPGPQQTGEAGVKKQGLGATGMRLKVRLESPESGRRRARDNRDDRKRARISLLCDARCHSAADRRVVLAGAGIPICLPAEGGRSGRWSLTDVIVCELDAQRIV